MFPFSVDPSNLQGVHHLMEELSSRGDEIAQVQVVGIIIFSSLVPVLDVLGLEECITAPDVGLVPPP